MYRMFVARRVREAWRRLDQRDYRFALDGFAPRFTYRFAGDHAIGGVRVTRAAMEAWFERIFRLFPDIRFEVEDVLVRGWPWRTRAVALVNVSATVDETAYRNELAQSIDIRFGRIVRVTTLEDTQKLAGALTRLAELGVDEAAAPAIEDPVPAAA